MAKVREITPKEYAEYRGWTEQNVTKHIRNNKIENLDYVIRVKKYSRFIVLEVPEWLSSDSFTEINKKTLPLESAPPLNLK